MQRSLDAVRKGGTVGRYYDEAIIPAALRRRYDVYARLRDLGISIGSFDEDVVSLAGRNIALVVFTECGLVYISGAAKGASLLSVDETAIRAGQEAGADAAAQQIRWLHWALSCGGEGGDLNDVLYTVKALGFVVSQGHEGSGRAPQVVNGYSFLWHSVFGGPGSQSAKEGVDPGGWAGIHARSALGGVDGAFAQEAEMIVAIPTALAQAVIAKRGWVFPLPPAMLVVVLDGRVARPDE